jgi:8-oxo-dGTP pyrophosphatase MutT (NUDIX family)
MILSAGIVIVGREGKEWKFLFLRAYRNWDFPKGIVETGEDPLETAKREVVEETGLSDLHFRWGHIYRETEPYSGFGGKKLNRYYIAETKSFQVVFSVNPEISRPEHHEYRWLTDNELLELSPKRLKSIVQWANSLISKD